MKSGVVEEDRVAADLRPGRRSSATPGRRTRSGSPTPWTTQPIITHRLRLLDRAGQVVPGHRRPERRQRPGLRRERQVPVLLRLDRRRARSRTGSRSRTPTCARRRRIYLAVLQNDVPSPLAQGERRGEAGAPARRPRSRREPEAEEADATPAGRCPRTKPPARRRSRSASTSTASSTASSTCRFRRPTLSNLQAGTAGQIYYLKTADGKTSLNRYDLTTRKNETRPAPKPPTTSCPPTARSCCIAAAPHWSIVPTTRKIEPAEGRIAVGRASRCAIDPRAEWKQIFDEAWRINRDYFYAPNMHGVDWKAQRDEVRGVPAARRDARRPEPRAAVDVERAGGRPSQRRRRRHASTEPKTVPGGLLGADYEVANGRYRFKKVYGGLNWNPQLRAPLTEPGVNVKAGEYLLAVNGKDLRPPTNVYSLFENTSGKIVEITRRAERRRHRIAHRAGRADRATRRRCATATGSRATCRRSTRRPAAAWPTSTCRTPPAPGTRTSSATSTRRSHKDADHRRRALQRRRQRGRLLHRHPAPAVHRQLGDALRRGSEDAVRVDPGAEGDAHRRDGRLGRRPAAVDVPQVQAGPARRQAHLGRPGRHPRLPGADGRRLRSPRRTWRSGRPRTAGSSRTRACRRTSRWSRRRPT